MTNLSNTETIIRLIASEQNWIEGEAVRQLNKTGELPGMIQVVGLPDLHPGRGNPIGAAFISQGRLYPYLIGNDVGCGMGLWKTDLKCKKMKRDRWIKRLSGLETPWDGDITAWLTQHGVAPTESDSGLGTIGGGNHFAELQITERIEDQQAFDHMGLDKDVLVLLVHSGSRGLGESLLRSHVSIYGAKGLEENTTDALRYIADHDHAVRWAAASRALIADRFLSCLGARGNCVSDVAHNLVTQIHIGENACWLHRKGAVPSDKGAVMIPGTRGSFSYLVMPVGNQEANAYSLAHGAGRKWNRSDSKKRLKARYTAESLTHTELGSRVICEDKDLLYEEAPHAYKKIERVVQDLLDAVLIKVIASFRPLITYKMRKDS